MRELRIWIGSVSSEKTTQALRAARRLVRRGHDLVLVRPTQSIRDYEEPGFLVTKNGEKWPAIDFTSARDIVEAAYGARSLWIDEPMLFDHEEDVFDAVQQVRNMMPVLISGLGATSEMEVFGTAMPRLLAVADQIIHCFSDCDYCGRRDVGSRSVYIGEAHKAGQVKTGGVESYKASCPSCWTEHTARVVAI